MRFTAKFAGGRVGSRDRDTGIVYYPFDVARISNSDSEEVRDKAAANAVGHIRDTDDFEGCDLLEVLVGHFLPPNYYKDPQAQQRVEEAAVRVPIMEYVLRQSAD